ncbi:MAG: tRNA pseudouridine(55) synthase TruB [Oscillospiraceae bacterium]|nr:tRNA pseudouridine(55) synthase TruB [Oscillospiraceae bacterium]
MANGIIIVDKPTDWTSQDVTAKLRGVFHERRIGHGGTLDPMATGVLPVFIGRATRAVEFMESAEKEYIAGLRLGLTTNTQDTTGEVLSSQSVDITKEQLLAVLPKFTGEIEQIPPMFSAVKIGGIKLYELARKGKEVERKPRRITIHELEVVGIHDGDLLLRVRCSKGTYIRTLCHDIGAALGCGGCMSSLRRTAAGQFSISDAVPLAELIAHPNAESLLRRIDTLFSDLPALFVRDSQTVRLKNGAAVTDKTFVDGTYRVYAENGEFLLLGKVEAHTLTTIKSFFEVKDHD